MPQAFSVVFQKAIAKAEPAEEVAARVCNLIDCITFSVYQYTSRGLFECDKLIFACQMTFQVNVNRLTFQCSHMSFEIGINSG